MKIPFLGKQKWNALFGNKDEISKKKRLIDEAKKITHRADQSRDQHDYLKAALLYRQALSMVPWRTDLIVQMANMFKDSGLCEEALQAYEEALRQTPRDPDIHLQVGRTLIMMGRKQAGIEMLHKALAIAPEFDEALYELGKNGVAGALARYHDGFVINDGVTAIRSLSADILGLHSSLVALAARLPDIETWSAVPVERYEIFRQLFDVVSVPCRSKSSIEIKIISLVDSLTIEQLYKQIESIQSQTYHKWVAIFCGRSDVARTAVKQLSIADGRFQWLEQPLDVTETRIERMAAAEARGWLLLLAEGTVLRERALEWFAASAGSRSCPIFCCDAEVFDRSGDAGATFSQILARWSFDPDIILQQNMWGDTLFVDAAVNAIHADSVDAQENLPGRRSALILEAGNIGHIPLVLVELPECKNELRLKEHYSAIQSYLVRKGKDIEVCLPKNKDSNQFSILDLKRKNTEVNEHISVIICTYNNAKDCKYFIESLDKKSSKTDNISYIIVDNGTNIEYDINILDSFINKENITILRMPGPFNWAYLNNRAAETVDDGIIVFANDDMLMVSDNWDDVIRAGLQDPSIGILGVKLLYPDQTIQHAGIMFGWNNSVIHDGLFREAASSSQFGRWQMERRVSAVTGAFMCIKKEKFRLAGGFDAQNFPVSYNDVDLCLTIRQAGYAIRWSPHIIVIHYESKSRGADYLVPEKRARDAMERAAIYRKWGKDVFSQDPTVNPVWYDATIPFSLLRPVTYASAFSYMKFQGGGVEEPFIEDVSV